MQEEYQTFEIFSDLYHKRKIELDELCLKGIKFEKLGASRKKTDEVKESDNLGQPFWWNCLIRKKN